VHPFPPAFRVLQQFEDVVRRSPDHGSAAGLEDRPLHQLWMLEQQLDDSFARLDVFLRQAEALEVLVLADQLRGRARQQVQQPF
jgi:hypothetical protein